MPTDKFQDQTDEDEDPFSLDPAFFCSEDPDPFDRIDERAMTSDQMEQSWLKLWSNSTDNDPPDYVGTPGISVNPLAASRFDPTADSIQSNVTERLDNEQSKCSDSVSSDNSESSDRLKPQQNILLLKSHPIAMSRCRTRQCSSSVVSGNVPEVEQVTSTELECHLILPNVVNVKMSVDSSVETSNRSRLSDW